MPSGASLPPVSFGSPVELTRRLVRCDTSNPPGSERECAIYLKSLLEEGGMTCDLIGSSADRPNLIARLPGQGKAPPLRIQRHMDVVPAPRDGWQHPPFEGTIADRYIEGRWTCKTASL